MQYKEHGKEGTPRARQGKAYPSLTSRHDAIKYKSLFGKQTFSPPIDSLPLLQSYMITHAASTLIPAPLHPLPPPPSGPIRASKKGIILHVEKPQRV